MTQIALTFDYNGMHDKAHVGKIDGESHLRMLLAAIDRANPRGEYDVIVAAIAFDIWSLESEDERMLAWEVYKRARVVIVQPGAQEHYTGACWCLRMATEAAAMLGADFMVHLADDVLLHWTPEAIVQQMGDADYIGSDWGEPNTLNTQVFACRTHKFANLHTRRFVFDPGSINGAPCESHAWGRATKFGLQLKIKNEWPQSRDDLYFHTHHVDRFQEECRRLGVSWPRLKRSGEQHLHKAYQRASQECTDIHEHCATLRGLAAQVSHVTEFGIRFAVSSAALLAGMPEQLVSYDTTVSVEGRRLAEASGGRMMVHEADVRTITIEPTDLLFIDTWHTYSQLRAELRIHAKNVRRWIVLHDTTTFGDVGEDGGVGLWPAVEEFISTHPEWVIANRVHYNNGLTILERKSC